MTIENTLIHADSGVLAVRSNTFVGNLVFGPVTIRPDGSVEIAQGVDTAAAATAFWQEVARCAPVHTHARILSKVRELAALTREPYENEHGSIIWTSLLVPTLLLNEIDDELRYIK